MIALKCFALQRFRHLRRVSIDKQTIDHQKKEVGPDGPVSHIGPIDGNELAADAEVLSQEEIAPMRVEVAKRLR